MKRGLIFITIILLMASTVFASSIDFWSDSRFHDNVNISGVTRLQKLYTGDIVTSGSAFFDGPLYVGYSFVIESNGDIDGKGATLDNDLTVFGTSILKGAVTAESDLFVLGTVNSNEYCLNSDCITSWLGPNGVLPQCAYGEIVYYDTFSSSWTCAALDSYLLPSCPSGQIAISTGSGSTWTCAVAPTGDTLPNCASGQHTYYDGAAWACIDAPSVTGDNLGNHIATTNLNMNNKKITNVITPTSNLEAANKIYVDNKVSNLIITPGSCSSGQILQYTGSGFICIDDITDISCADGQGLVFNAGTWGCIDLSPIPITTYDWFPSAPSAQDCVDVCNYYGGIVWPDGSGKICEGVSSGYKASSYCESSPTRYICTDGGTCSETYSYDVGSCHCKVTS